jgi:hypothetical protein
MANIPERRVRVHSAPSHRTKPRKPNIKPRHRVGGQGKPSRHMVKPEGRFTSPTPIQPEKPETRPAIRSDKSQARGKRPPITKSQARGKR